MSDLTIPDDLALTDNDMRMLCKLGGFIPEKVFDIHAHLFNIEYLPNIGVPGSIFAGCGPVADKERYEELQKPLYHGVKQLRLNLVSTPDKSMSDLTNGYRSRCNEFLIEYLKHNPMDVGEAFVLPGDTDPDIEKLLGHPNIRGLKCYHLTAGKESTWQAEIDDYLPESAWRVANERGLCITLHMVKDAALADSGNLEIIRRKAKQYPHAKLILAHAARGFAPWTTLEGLKQLDNFSNIYFDVSAVCEPTAIFAVLKAAGAARVLWGSDFPVSMMRGKCISIAGTFLWLNQTELAKLGDAAAAEACLVGIENLNALAQACDMLDLNRGEVEDIFYNNAMKVFDLSD